MDKKSKILAFSRRMFYFLYASKPLYALPERYNYRRLMIIDNCHLL